MTVPVSTPLLCHLGRLGSGVRVRSGTGIGVLRDKTNKELQSLLLPTTGDSGRLPCFGHLSGRDGVSKRDLLGTHQNILRKMFYY